jgi:PAS domain S-box-containing protein
MDIRRLRLLTIAGPVVFLLALEVFSLFVLLPATGGNAVLRLSVIFVILVVAAIPFSVWVFEMIERQHRDLTRSAEMLANVRDYAIYTLDVHGRFTGWSPGAERLMGYHGEEVLGQPLSIFYPEEDIQAGMPERNLEQCRATGRTEYGGWRIRKDGSRFWADVVCTSTRDADGTLLGFTLVARDLTERREAEERIRALNEALEQRVRQLAAMNQAITAISSVLDLSSVLQNIADAARDLVPSRYAALGVTDENGRVAQFITSGITLEQRMAIGPLPQGHGLIGTLIEGGAPLRVPDISRDPRSHGFPPNHPPMTSLLGVPILFKDRPVGDLYLTERIGAAVYSQEDQDLLMLLANHAAVAIENARLHAEVREARDHLQVWNEELEARVAERTEEIARFSREMTTRVLQAQEEERKRIARELHDDTAQSLSTILINFDLLEPFVPEENEVLRTGFKRVGALVKRTLDSTRALSHDLRPTILDDFGLVAALHWFADEYMKTFGVPVEVQVEDMGDRRLAPEVELALFRIAQEALTNTGKYAEASGANVSLTFPDGTARLVVQDNGKGFDVKDVHGPSRQGGLGLYGIQERADLLSGTLDINSKPGKGTRVTVIVPLNGDGADEVREQRADARASGEGV